MPNIKKNETVKRKGKREIYKEIQMFLNRKKLEKIPK
jgi:hypothetical protein